MEHHAIIELSGIFILGAVAQWLAMRLHLPSILFLLIFGFLAGPVFGFIHPDQLLGDLLFPFISLCVAVILFEGGMDLKFNELRGSGRIVFNLISIGVLVAWVSISLAAYLILGIDPLMSVLIGAILVVSGPTVVGPLLRHVRPSGRVGTIVKWEGILNDPVGVLLAILVFESIIIGNFQQAGLMIIFSILKTLFLSSAIGIGAALVLGALLKRYLIPDALHQSVTLMFVFGAFVLSNLLQAESGLLAVTLMGIVLANQKQLSVRHIVEFKENLRVLMISILFIILAARVDFESLLHFDIRLGIFLAVLIFIIRPLTVYCSSINTGLKWREILFLSWMAPRGIVAAAMASLFTYELVKHDIEHTEVLVPIVFAVITVTVATYGLSITPLARMLGIAKKNPQGFLILGGQVWVRLLAQRIKEYGFSVILIDTNQRNVNRARKEGFVAFNENVLSEHIEQKISLDDIGRMLCMTPNDEANALASLHFNEILGRANVYQLMPQEQLKEDESARHLQGRYLFANDANFEIMIKRVTTADDIKEILISESFDMDEFLAQDSKPIPLFGIHEDNSLSVLTSDHLVTINPGDRLMYI